MHKEMKTSPVLPTGKGPGHSGPVLARPTDTGPGKKYKPGDTGPGV